MLPDVTGTQQVAGTTGIMRVSGSLDRSKILGLQVHPYGMLSTAGGAANGSRLARA